VPHLFPEIRPDNDKKPLGEYDECFDDFVVDDFGRWFFGPRVP
jgi:hypothetical protein